MSITERVQSDLTKAMKAKDRATTSALRGLVSAFKTASVAEGATGELSDEQATDVLAKQAKQRQESIDAYEQAGRDDLVEKERFELDVIRRYLPEQLDENQLAGLVDEAITETGAQGPDDFGRVMSTVMPKVKGRADGKQVNQLVRERLGA